MPKLRHREQVLAHARKQLALRGQENSSELLVLYKKFLKIENHRLRLKHYAGGDGRDIAQQRATLVDIVLRHLFEAAAIRATGGNALPPGIALIAIGGYGRDELNPYSDVDIMFLHDEKRPFSVQDVVESILYMLWDVGYKVGHSTRTIAGAIKQANLDMLSKTALLESRLIAGDKILYEKFRREFVKNCVKGHEKQYIEDRIKNQAERHEKHGRSVYMQEPNVKNGCGGLRDYQNLLWISYFQEGILTTTELVEKKFLQEGERSRLEKAYDFLLRVRTELHYLNKRATDVLSLSFQMQVANKFEYPQKNALRRSEAFMKDYYQHARNIYYITELLSERLSLKVGASRQSSGLLSFLKTKNRKKQEFDRFCAIGNLMYPEARDIFNQDPARMMRLFQHAQQRHLYLSAELQQLIRRKLPLVDRTYRYAREPRETFKAILSRKGEVGRILRMMHEVDFLGRYVPEFGDLTCLVQHEFFHRYTADEHTLVCIEKLDQLIDTENPKLQNYKTLFQKLEDPFVLYLALLLHDTGKASNAKYHSEASALFAQKVATRLQLTSEQRKSLILLVDHHMTLSSIAQRRNLDDPATIEEFVEIVKNQANLDALMLLTLADGQGVGDENWSDWKESLVWHLYTSTSQYLLDGAAFYEQRRIEREGLRDAVRKKLTKGFEEEINAHFQFMPELYFQTYRVPEIAGHLKLFRQFMEERFLETASPEAALTPAMKWIAHPASGHSEVWVCTWDLRALLAKIAGSFAVMQINILSADIYTRGDNLVLDIFRVCDTKFRAVTDEKEMAQVEKHLQKSLTQPDFDFAPLLQRAKKKGYHLSQEIEFPTRIMIDNDQHPVYTLVEIQTPDRLGLLYNLLNGFGKVGVNIALSRITTEKGAAIDNFYVTDAKGKKISRQGIEELQKVLREAAAKSLL